MLRLDFHEVKQEICWRKWSNQVTSVPQSLVQRGKAARLRSLQWGDHLDLGCWWPLGTSAPKSAQGMGSDGQKLASDEYDGFIAGALLNRTENWSKLGSVGSWPLVVAMNSWVWMLNPFHITRPVGVMFHAFRLHKNLKRTEYVWLPGSGICSLKPLHIYLWAPKVMTFNYNMMTTCPKSW